jgi:hypothetical protein
MVERSPLIDVDRCRIEDAALQFVGTARPGSALIGRDGERADGVSAGPGLGEGSGAAAQGDSAAEHTLERGEYRNQLHHIRNVVVECVISDIVIFAAASRSG